MLLEGCENTGNVEREGIDDTDSDDGAGGERVLHHSGIFGTGDGISGEMMRIYNDECSSCSCLVC